MDVVWENLLIVIRGISYEKYAFAYIVMLIPMKNDCGNQVPATKDVVLLLYSYENTRVSILESYEFLPSFMGKIVARGSVIRDFFIIGPIIVEKSIGLPKEEKSVYSLVKLQVYPLHFFSFPVLRVHLVIKMLNNIFLNADYRKELVNDDVIYAYDVIKISRKFYQVRIFENYIRTSRELNTVADERQ